MDNNNNNDFNGFTPQKPFTDKSTQNNENIPQSPDNSSPSDNNVFGNAQIPQAPQNFAESNIPQNNEFQNQNTQYENTHPQNIYGNINSNQQNQPYAQNANINGSEQPPKQPDYNDYSQSSYNNYGDGQVPNSSPYNAEHSYNYGQQNNNFQPNQPNSQYYGNQSGYVRAPIPPKKKMSKGLLAIIIILCVLLSSSLTGFGVYIAVKATDQNSQSNSINQFMPSQGNNYTIPQQGGTTPQTQETSPTGNHSESDYSSKTKSDFDGIKLNTTPSDASKNSSYNAESAFNKVSDSVVGIVCYSSKITTVENCDSQGSGIIITSDGYVITNAHVIGNSKTSYLIQVITSDGKSYNAGVVGFDSRTDIAVLKMDKASGLSAATFGDSDKIVLGEDIIAVGNPGGLDYQNSITKGIVSAVNRSLSSTSLVKYIQTDAAINPGNSGGPIVNLYGQVIGIATSKIVSEKYEGMGFAIPSATAKSIIDDLVKNGYVNGRVKIGISGKAIDSSTAESNNVPQGIYVEDITKGGPCDGSGLKMDDIITSVDGKEVKTFGEVYQILEGHKAGDKIKLKYYRMSDGSTDTIEITLQEDK